MEFVAHRRERDGAIQNLWDHLEGTSFLAAQFASKIGLDKHGELIGLLHDLGKATVEFDHYIRSATGLIDPDEDDYVDATSQKGKIDHSSAGAQVINNYFNNQGNDCLFVLQILSLVIASHHSGIIDCLTPDGEDNFSKRMNKAEQKTRITEAQLNLDNNIKSKIDKLLTCDNLVEQLNQKLKSLHENNDSKESYMLKTGLLVRFLFSCLIDADRIDTADFEFPEKALYRNQGNCIDWSVLLERLNLYLAELKKKNLEGIVQVDNTDQFTVVNKLREEISNHCFNFADRPKGLYQLTVPTGGGKTLSSLRFALNHANKHSMDRIFYIIPYTSIIDQNANTVREILESRSEQEAYLNKIVLEHHSNLTPEKENIQQKLLAENWDAPVVFTTMVQFLEALFGYSTRSARRMHQLANAVIIFDEIQTLPIRCVHLFNIAVRFLIQACGSTVVLCTATQPLLDRVNPATRALQITSNQQMVPDVKRLFKELKRVEVFDQRKIGGWATIDIGNLVEKELCETGSVLVVVNTKKGAINLFREISRNQTAKTYHLSTNMCPAHRLDVLSNIKKCLLNREPVICVSTQLIEAGVDIDFGSVIRYLAGLDSIAQAAGRCNRNGTRTMPGRVFIVNPKEENLDKLEDIRIARDKAERVLDEYQTNPKQFDQDILSTKAMERYYQYYFYERKEEMCYKVSSSCGIGRLDNLFELLSTNKLSVQAYQRVNNKCTPHIAMRQSFMTAGKIFQAIDAPTRGVVVPYTKEGESIINELCVTKIIEKQFRLIKKAQRYSVNIFPYLFEKLAKQGVIREVQKGSNIFYLDKHYYSYDFGIDETPVKEMELLNI
jgi:CRISPR-associated endonuclease/helicase Cas3